MDQTRHVIRQMLTEAAGTLGWYHPETGRQIGVSHMEHGEYIEASPEQFELSDEDVSDIMGGDHPEGPYAALIQEVLKLGWARINHFRGSLYVHAADLAAARSAAREYAVEQEWWPEEIVVDVGLYEAMKSFTLERDDWIDWVEKGRLPGEARLRSLYAWRPKLDETLQELEREELSYHASGSPLLVSKLSRRGSWFILDGHHRAVEAVRRGEPTITIVQSADVPNIEHGGGYRDMLAKMVNLVDYVAADR